MTPSTTPEFSKALKTLSPAQQIRMARTDSGLSRNQLCKALDTSNSRLCYLESDPSANPTYATMARIAQETGLHAVVMLVRPYEVIPLAESFLERRKKRAKDLLEQKVAMNILAEDA